MSDNKTIAEKLLKEYEGRRAALVGEAFLHAKHVETEDKAVRLTFEDRSRITFDVGTPTLGCPTCFGSNVWHLRGCKEPILRAVRVQVEDGTITPTDLEALVRELRAKEGK